MTAPHPYLAIRSQDQWRRVAHNNTSLTVSEDGVVLCEDAASDSAFEPVASAKVSPLCLAFDPNCRLYSLHSRSSNVFLNRNIDDPAKHECQPLFAKQSEAIGEFNWLDNSDKSQIFNGLSVDSSNHLFISEKLNDRIWVLDMVDRRLIRFVQLPTDTNPQASDADGLDVYVTTQLGLGVMTYSSEFRFMKGQLAGNPYDRVAVFNGVICVLENACTADAKVIPWDYPEHAYAAPFASDIIFTSADQLVISFGRGDLFEKHVIDVSNGHWSRVQDGYMRAKGYDGRGIVRSPEGRVGYHSKKGFRYALPVKAKYKTRGRIISFALDSGVYQNQWGLAFIDACIPRNCDVRVKFHASDEIESNFLLTRTTAANDGDFRPVLAPERSPSTPKDTAFDVFSTQSIDNANKLYRRGVDDELIWDEYRENESLVTYETPVMASAGRYLWVAIELAGSGTASPTVSALRVQKNGHRLLQQLPKLYSRDQSVEAFLRRYLALPESMFNEFDVSSLTRHVLLDPTSCREEWLSWLASFVGLAFDERFNPATRRQLIEEVAWLFRFRGTVIGLQRFLQIYADNQLGEGTVVQIIERFKFRGHSAFQDPADENINDGSVLGVDYRMGSGVSGELGDDTPDLTGVDPYAHRFVVLIAANMSTDESEIINNIIATHRPAHTVFEVCSVDAGIRIGRGLYLELNSFVGQSGGFQSLHLESGTLGRNGVLGIPKTASSSTGGRVGLDARMG